MFPLRLRGSNSGRSPTVKSQSPREAGNGVFPATEEEFAGATEVALTTADAGAEAGLGATRLEGRCLHPRARLLGRERW